MNTFLSSWRKETADSEAVEKLVSSLDLPQPIAKILVQRGFDDSQTAETFLSPSLKHLKNPLEFPGIEKVCQRMEQALKNKEQILVHGDFDADGITSCAILISFLRQLGSQPIAFMPDRMSEKHGISPRAIELAKEQNVSLFLTCDCGTSSGSSIQALHQLGIDVIITDHHEVSGPWTFPALLVNPKQNPPVSSWEEFAGVGVAFMVCVALRTYLRERNFFQSFPEPNMKEYLDWVALGSIADMSPMVSQNRILVAQGLEQLGSSPRPGMLALKAVAGLSRTGALKTSEIEFRLAPRVNAAARLGHAEEALHLFLETDFSKAEKQAQQLESWNQERKSFHNKMIRISQVEVQKQIEENRSCIVLSSPEFHPGILGLLAQYWCEKVQRPTFVFVLQGDTAKGSGRSIPGLDLFQCMVECREILNDFGGHSRAGGCTLPSSKISEFIQRLERFVQTKDLDATQELIIDAEVDFGQLNKRFISFLNRLGPFGVGNAEPIFSTKAGVVGSPSEMGKGHLKATLRDSKGVTMTAVGFGLWSALGKQLRGNVEIAFTPEENDWNHGREIRLRIKDVRPA